MPNSKTGERKLQILQALAGMLESPKAEKVTTAALAAKLDVSEAALYRHFASKAQMYEGFSRWSTRSPRAKKTVVVRRSRWHACCSIFPSKTPV
jgi:AcrR family transcriptional regulator